MNVWVLTSGSYDDYLVHVVLAPGTTEDQAEAIAAELGYEAEQRPLLTGMPVKVPYLSLETKVKPGGTHGDPHEVCDWAWEHEQDQEPESRTRYLYPGVAILTLGTDFDQVRIAHAEQVAKISEYLASNPPPPPPALAPLNEVWYDANGRLIAEHHDEVIR